MILDKKKIIIIKNKKTPLVPHINIQNQTQIKNKVSLHTSLEKNPSNFSYISFLGVNFENLTV